MSWVIRYRPDSDLGRRFTGHSAPHTTRAEAEALLRLCVNSACMEIIEVDEEPHP